MAKKQLTLAQVKERVREHMTVALDIDSFSITFARLEGNTWKLNIEFSKGDAWDF